MKYVHFFVTLYILCLASGCAGQLPSNSDIAPKNKQSFSEMDFNFEWKFTLEDRPQFKNENFNDATWRDIRLPHDWSIEKDFDENLNGATAYLPGGVGWYRKTFTLTKEQQHQTIYLLFDGIYNHSTLWLNGKKIGGKINGYTPFFYDITSHLKKRGQNTLAVRVDRSRYIDSRWYTGSGIYRNVKLVTKNKLHLPIWGTQLTTPSVSQQFGEVVLDIDVVNQYEKTQSFELRTSIVDSKGNTITSAKSNSKIENTSTLTIRQTVDVDMPELWSPDNPNLYYAQTDIIVEGKTVDRRTIRFGFRHLKFDPNKGFFLNGVSTEIRGVNLHHDAGLVGAAVPDDVWRRRLNKLKEAGVNAIRTAHNPASENFLNLCDEMGFLVQAEIFDEWDNPKDKRLNQWERHDDYISRGYAEYFQEHAESDLKLAIRRDRNHPSIFMWSIGNEIEWTYPRYKDATGYFDMNAAGNYFYNPPFIPPEEIFKRFHDSPEGQYVLAKTAKKLSKWVKELDTTRPVTANMILPSVSHISGYGDALDVIGYSYRRVIYDYGHTLFPEKMIYGAENVAQWHEWKAVEERDFIPGTFLWTGVDYLGEANDAWPRKAVRSGLLDLAGFENPSFHMFKSLWTDTPHIQITSQVENKSLYKRNKQGVVVEKEPGQWDKRVWVWQDVHSHWNYKKNDKIIAEILTNCPSVELFLNNRSLGTQTLADNKDHILKWALTFEAGLLEAKGCDTSHQINTAGPPAKIVLTSDKPVLNNDRYSVAHIVAQLYDKNGIPVRHDNTMIKFDVPKNLDIIGTDNGRSSLITKYKTHQLQTHQGRAILIVRAEKPGPFLIEAKAKNISNGKIRLR